MDILFVGNLEILTTKSLFYFYFIKK